MNHTFYKVDFDAPMAIRLIGDFPKFEHTAFHIIGKNGMRTGWVGELAPDDLRHLKVFPCLREDATSSIPMGISNDIQIVAALLCLAYPQGIIQPIADFKRIDEAVKTKKLITLPSLDDAKQVVSYAPFDEEWFNSMLALKSAEQ